MIDLAAIKKRLEAATPGPWEAMMWSQPPTDLKDFSWVRIENVEKGWTAFSLCDRHNEIHNCDATFIAHAPTDIANLLDALEKLKEAMKSAAFCLSKNSAHKFEIEEDLEKTLKEIFGGETK